MPAAARLCDLLDDLRKQTAGTELEGLVDEIYAAAGELIEANENTALLITRAVLPALIGDEAALRAASTLARRSARLRPVAPLAASSNP